jgi:hypothetical protein
MSFSAGRTKAKGIKLTPHFVQAKELSAHRYLFDHQTKKKKNYSMNVLSGGYTKVKELSSRRTLFNRRKKGSRECPFLLDAQR